MLKRFSVAAYTQILTGSMLRLAVQAGYFALLVNALPLADYGVFASVLAFSLILSGGGAFGFAAPLFRAATTRRPILGAYLSAFLVYASLECGIILVCGVAIYGFTFRYYLPLETFLCIFVSETVFWRVVDVLTSLNIGLGQYRRGTAAAIIGSAGRLAAVALFVALGKGGLDRWGQFYLAGNAVTTVLVVALLWPRVRLRWRSAILLHRSREALSYWAINTLQTFQIEADKLLVLSLAGQEHVGVYALSMRVIELMLLPIKSFFPPYVQSLLRNRDRFANWRRSLAVEGMLSLVALGLFFGAVAALAVFPHILGSNIARAARWFENLPLVPVSRALLDYHREVMFAAERLTTYAAVAFVLAVTRLGSIASVLLLTASIDALVVPLNCLAVTLYCVSAAVVWRLVIRPPIFAKRIAPARAEDFG